MQKSLVTFLLGVTVSWLWVSLAIAYVGRLQAAAAWFVGALALLLLFGALGALTLVAYLLGSLLLSGES